MRRVTLERRHKQIHIKNYIIDILVTILLSAVLSCIGILLSDVVDMTNIQRYLDVPLLFLLNMLPAALVMLLLFHLSARHWVSFGIGGGLYILMHVINRFMMQLREEPFTPADFMLGTEAANVVRISELPFNSTIILSFAFWLAASVLLFFFVKSEKLRLTVRIAGAAAVIALFAVAFAGIYKDTRLYDSFKVTGSIYSKVNQYKSRGFAYSFLVRSGTFKSIKPENYSRAEAQQILSGFSEPAYNVNKGRQPHIIAVMGEAFYDMDRIEGIEFNEGYDPLANFKRIAGKSYTGRLVTNVFGGGTANTEFSFLTGHSMPVMPELTSPYSFYLRRDTFSLTRVLEKLGYSSMAFHPGDSWFYNRVNVYGFFGFDNIFFKNDMDKGKIELNHGYISDRSTAEFTLEKFKSHISQKPDVPFFEFVVNIDNHGPYSKNNLGYPDILKRSNTMDESVYNTLNNYLYGLMRCDTALGYFADSISEMEEPVVFLYFADHLPFLGENYQGYRALGFNIGPDKDLEAFLNQYETPYFIMCNEAAKKLFKDSGAAPLTGAAPKISSNYLAAELLKYAGINGGGYFNYLAGLKEKLPVITNRFIKEGDTFTEKPSDDTKSLLEQYGKLQYYMMMEKAAVNP